jgi:mRNA interferase MazF
MYKNFDEWNSRKKLIDLNSESPDFHEREMWWCAIGVNVGSEQHSQTKDFSRPVVIVKKFTRDICLTLPLTTKIKKDESFRVRFNVYGVENDALILQMRVLDRKRLIRKIDVVSKKDFARIIKAIRELW